MSANPAILTAITPDATEPPRNSRAATAVVWAGVFAGFLAYSLIQAPIPGPNEPHYLCKAKHYWDAEFCPNDLFLKSSNAHLVFYQTVGLLTRFLSLEETALAARVLAYGFLAFSWTSCVRRISGDAWHALWAAWVFLAMANFGNLSGEWIVGGVESKVFAYGFLLWGIAQCLDRRWLAAGAAAGLSISFHPVVGVWGVIAAVLAVVAGRLWQRAPEPRPTPPVEASRWNSPRTALGIGLLCALPGLVPALGMVANDRQSDTAEANRIQVFERLPHHLDPTHFRIHEIGDYEIETAWLQYAVMAVFWLSLSLRWNRSAEESWFGRFVLATGLIALAGVVVALFPRTQEGFPADNAPLADLRVTLMKFYPFRLFDVFLPMAVAIAVTRSLAWRSLTADSARDWLGRLAAAGIFGGFLVFALVRPIPDRNPSHMHLDQRADWIATCRWVYDNTPADAHVLTPTKSNWAFKWYAQRAEYRSYKDCPQDAASILEWRRRQRSIDEWSTEYYEYEEYSKSALRVLLEKERITHVIVDVHIMPFDIDPVFENKSYRVYRLKDALDPAR